MLSRALAFIRGVYRAIARVDREEPLAPEATSSPEDRLIVAFERIGVDITADAEQFAILVAGESGADEAGLPLDHPLRPSVLNEDDPE